MASWWGGWGGVRAGERASVGWGRAYLGDGKLRKVRFDK